MVEDTYVRPMIGGHLRLREVQVCTSANDPLRLHNRNDHNVISF